VRSWAKPLSHVRLHVQLQLHVCLHGAIVAGLSTRYVDPCKFVFINDRMSAAHTLQVFKLISNLVNLATLPRQISSPSVQEWGVKSKKLKISEYEPPTEAYPLHNFMKFSGFVSSSSLGYTLKSGGIC